MKCNFDIFEKKFFSFSLLLFSDALLRRYQVSDGAKFFKVHKWQVIAHLFCLTAF